MSNNNNQKDPIISHASSSFSGTINVPGDKSISHRSLMLSSQFLGKTTVTGMLEGEDVIATAEALKKLGVTIEKRTDGTWEVTGIGIGGLSEPTSALDMGNAGTGARLMMGLLSSYDFTSTFIGDASLSSRPMGRVTTPLEKIGATFMCREGGRLPLTMKGSAEPMPINYTLPVASAQVKSAILLAALNIAGKTTVVEPVATRDHTEKMLRYFGVNITTKEKDGANHISITGHPDIKRQDHHINVAGDPSSAAFPMVAALLIEGADITIQNVGINPLRTGLFDTLIEMGANLTLLNKRDEGGEPVADIQVKHSQLKGVEVPADRAASMIDEYPILAVAAAFAKGNTIMNGLAELKVKESDRLQAIIDGLTLCGVKTSLSGAENDNLTVYGQEGRVEGSSAPIKTHLDHRIAMSFLVLGVAATHPVEVDDGTAIATSFPNFIELMNSLGANFSETSAQEQEATKKATTQTPSAAKAKQTASSAILIAIDGPAASGKGTLARKLADHYGTSYLDTGRLYRAVALKLVFADKDPHNKEDAIEAAQSINDHDLSNPKLRQEQVGKYASILSAIPEVREILLDYQRDYTKKPEGAVLDGRDIGTVVCPDAKIKLFITAGVEARAGRRHRELQGQGLEVKYDSVLQDLKDRDRRDKERKAAPLKPADDAFMIDTTTMRIDDVFETITKYIDDIIASNATAA